MKVNLITASNCNIVHRDAFPLTEILFIKYSFSNKYTYFFEKKFDKINTFKIKSLILAINTT